MEKIISTIALMLIATLAQADITNEWYWVTGSAGSNEYDITGNSTVSFGADDGNISAYSTAGFNSLSVGASNGGYALALLKYTFTIDPSYDDFWVDIDIFADLDGDSSEIQFTRDEYYYTDVNGDIRFNPSDDYIFVPEENSLTTTTFSFSDSAFPYEQTLILSAKIYSQEGNSSELRVNLTTGVGPSTVPGDVNGDSRVDLADAILCLQILSGLAPANINPAADITRDGKIGMEEVIYAIQKEAGYL